MTRYALLLASVAVPLAALAQVPGSLDMSFNPSDSGQGNGLQFVGNVLEIALHTDGKIAVIGTFITYDGVDRKRVALLNADGSLDTLFEPGLGTENGSAYAVAFQPDGRIIIGGAFTSYNGNATNRMVRLLPNGAIDPEFDPGLGPDGSVSEVVVQPDSKILIGGGFSTYNGVARSGIARLNSDGSLDTSFDPGTGTMLGSVLQGSVGSITLQPDGKIVIGGTFYTYNDQPCSMVARLEADGSLDTTFNASDGPNSTVRTMALQPDGKIVIGGSFSTVNGIAKGRVARLNSDGSLDTGFGAGVGAGGMVYSVALQADNKVLVGGTITQYDGISCSRIVRLNTDGTVDLTAVLSADNNVQAITVRPDGMIMVGGNFTTFNGRLRGRFARIEPDGSTDPGFYLGTGVNATVRTMAVAQDGKVLIGGDFTSVNGVDRMRIARLHADGSLDTEFDPGEGANGIVWAIAPLADGKMLVGGAFSTYNGVPYRGLVRLLPDGSLDPGFKIGSGPSSSVYAINVRPDGMIVVAGGFVQFNGVDRYRVARLYEDGTLDMGFDPYPVANAFGVYCMTVQDDGKVLLGGRFDAVPSMKSLARLNADGSLDSAGFNTGTGFSHPSNLSVDALLVLPDGKIMVGGRFTTFNGIDHRDLVRLNSDGSLDETFDKGAGPSGPVVAMAIQPGGKVLIGGFFSSYNGVTSESGLALLHLDGTLDEGFNDGHGGDNNGVHTIALQPDGQILIGGSFRSFNNIGRNRIARLHGGDPDWRLRLRVKVYLGGNSLNSGLMMDRLRTLQLIPTTEPYTALGYQHALSGGGEVISGSLLLWNVPSSAFVDWVVLELRSTSSPATVLATRSALLKRDGYVVDLDGRSSVSFDLPPGDYFVAVRHRNHLGCMTAVPRTFTTGTVVVDFTTSTTATWGINARKNLSGTNTMLLWPGDANFDGRIKYLGANNDRDVVLATVGAATPQNIVTDVYSVADVNMDGKVMFEGPGNDPDVILQSLPAPNVPHTVRVEQIPNGMIMPIGMGTW